MKALARHFTLALLAMFVISMPHTAHAAAQVDFSIAEQASKEFVRILAKYDFESPELTVVNFQANETITAAKCAASVLRAESGDVEKFTFSESNYVSCTFSQGDSTGTLMLSLAHVEVSPWGDETHKKSFKISGQLAVLLMLHLQYVDRLNPGNPYLRRELAASSDGKMRRIAFEIATKPTAKSTSGVECLEYQTYNSELAKWEFLQQYCTFPNF